MKKIYFITLCLFVINGFAQNNNTATQGPQEEPPVQVLSQEEIEGDDIYQRQESEKIGKRKEIQEQQEGDLGAQLQQAKENVKIDETNIKRAEDRKKDSESQVEIDEAAIEKHEAQLQEDKAQVKRLEEKMGKDKKDKKGLFD